jgi:PAS domain S-box-containing protein
LARGEVGVDEAEDIRGQLASVPDPVALLEGLFAYAPVAVMILRADGHALIANAAFRELFGTTPQPEYNLFQDEIASAAGLSGLIGRAFAGETIQVPATWYDARRLAHVRVDEARRVAVTTILFPIRDRAGGVSHVAAVFRDVTTEVAAAEAAEARRDAAEAQLDLRDAIIANSGDGIIACDDAGVIRTFNRAAERQHGVGVREVPPPAWAEAYGLERLDGGPLPLDEHPLFRALRGEHVSDARWAVRRPDGTRRVLCGTAAPVTRPEGARGAVLITRDETERLRLEAEVRAREEQFRFLAESMPQIVWTARPDGTLDYLNERFVSYVGVAVEAGLGAGWLEIIHPDDRDATLAQWSLARSLRISLDLEHRVRRHDGIYRWFLSRATPMLDATGEVVKWFGTSTDVHDLKTSEARLRSLFDADLLGVGFWDASGEVSDCNDRMLAILGATRDDLANRRVSWRERTPPEHAARDEQAVRDLRAGGRIAPFEKEYVRPDGTRVPVIIGGAFLPGSTCEGAFFALDVTEQVRARQEIERLVGELGEAIKVRDQFLSIAGHELRTPLTALQLQVQGLQRLVTDNGPAPPRLAERLARMDRHVGRLDGLIAQLLDVSRITAGRLELRPEPCELVAIVREVIERYGPQLGSCGSAIVLDAPGELAGEWDRLRLDQVISNLLGNAIKYGEGKPIDVVVAATADRARVVVRDRGIGISPEDQQRIFERFERAVSVRHYGGLGLGLWITRQIVEAHDGTIAFESSPGAGTTFIVELPRRPR